MAYDCEMPGSTAFVDQALTGLSALVAAGHLARDRWTVEGPYKMPNSSAGGAATYAAEIDGYEVVLRRYRPRSGATDSFDWCFGVSVASEGVVLGWRQSDDGTASLGRLVTAVEKLIEPQVHAGREGFIRALGD